MHCTLDLELTPEIIHQTNASLASLLSKSALEQQPVTLTQLRLQQSGVEANASVAAITARADGLPELPGTWAIATPVHLVLQRDAFSLYPEVPIKVSAKEAEAYLRKLNSHFEASLLQFYIGRSGQWYAHTKQTDIFLAFKGLSHPSHALGQMIDGFMPEPSKAKEWLQIHNEIQMLLFASEENLAREQSGELPINSLWFYGAAETDTPHESKRDLHYLSNSPFYHGVASATQALWERLPSEPSGLQHIIAQSKADRLVIDLTLEKRLDEWLSAMQALLKQRHIKTLTIQLGWRELTLVAVVKPMDRWRFWRKTHGIKHYLK